MDASSLYQLNGRTILITGASSGIGRATAIACASAGAKIILTGRNEQRLEDVRLQLDGDGHQVEVFDLSDLENAAKLAGRCPVVHGVVHSAGIYGVSPMRQVQSQMLEHVMRVNLIAPIVLTQKILYTKKIANGGSILFLSSIAAKSGTRGVGPYSASKASLIGAMRPLALEVAKLGIRVNALCPGIVDTPIFAGQEEWLANEVAPTYPLGIGKPEDVANAALFFMSDASRKITGTDFSLDGGVVIN
jgi:NAD(P)-dependent dehydrogenase (short-subunit alcohol dehydrogenase family)